MSTSTIGEELPDQVWQLPHMLAAMRRRDVAAVFDILQQHGMSQRRIAMRTGQSQSEVSAILTGGRIVQTVAVLERIADGLGIPRDAFGLAAAGESADPAASPSRGRRPVKTPVRSGDATVGLWSGRQVWALRTAMRRSLREFADYLGVTPRAVSNWESGSVPSPTNQSVLDTVLERADDATRRRFTRLTGTTPAGRHDDERDEERTGWVVHLLIDVPDQSAALRLADDICHTVAQPHPQVVAGATTISRADRQSTRRFVYCDKRLPGDTGRCGRPHRHRGPCWPRDAHNPTHIVDASTRQATTDTLMS